MALPDTETILAAAGLVATGAVWAVERFLPGRKRIGYRVQMDTAIGMNPQAAHSIVQLRLLRENQEVADATLALLRVENDGSKDIVRHDYQEPLTVRFPGRTVVGVEVPDANPPTLQAMLTRNNGLRPEGSRLVVPKVPLNRRDHFKLLVLLSGSGDRVAVDGFLSGGRIRRNAQRRGPSTPHLALGGIFIILVGLLCGLLLSSPGRTVDATACASGRLTVDGSTAFAPPMAEIGKAYEKQCPGAEITVHRNGSLAGLGNLDRAGRAARGGSPGFIAMSDVPAPESYRGLGGRQPVGIVLLSLVANRRNGVDNLTLAQVRKIYDGTYTDWRQLGGADQPIRLVSRDSRSGTRRTFETRVLDRSETAVVSSFDCATRDRDRRARVTRCEVNSTGDLLDTVNRVSGAIGYTETYAATEHRDVVTVRLDGHEPDIEWGRQRDYPFWAVEYLYTYGRPEDGSLTAKFLAFMNSDTAKNLMRMYKHVPCADRQSVADSACRP
ncbi:substrate-binding domain-containing protein [Streptomyces sp. XD-27]|uniref:substrate-binding domain-containing protein n=1 Tax=Streptomyces sp. XD-27 TaxID=3062779 RepID=UPI0026F43A1D|nr:substrate-binding domain-containing protein [Streptomyces sp. XD-27]WKX70278.1 substrate-binding domain-containing protein [Streptomyces sp. XD-27]